MKIVHKRSTKDMMQGPNNVLKPNKMLQIPAVVFNHVYIHLATSKVSLHT